MGRVFGEPPEIEDFHANRIARPRDPTFTAGAPEPTNLYLSVVELRATVANLLDYSVEILTFLHNGPDSNGVGQARGPEKLQAPISLIAGVQDAHNSLSALRSNLLDIAGYLGAR